MNTVRMSVLHKALITAGLIGLTSMSIAAENVSERELHYVRGVLERSSTLGKFSQLAIEKSSNEKVKAFAKRTIDEYTAQNKSLATLAGKLGITGAGIGNGGAAAAGGAPSGAPSGAPGAAPGGAPNGAGPNAGGATAGMGAAPAGAGGPPAAAGAAAGGMAAGGAAGNSNSGPAGKAQAIMAQLQQASGEEFDNLYLLRAIQYHEDIERNIIGEIMTETANPELLKWSKDNIAAYTKNAKSAQALVFGEEERSAPPAGAAAPGAAPNAGAAGRAPAAK